jgi:uncharacterized lipoprotein YbaY
MTSALLTTDGTLTIRERIAIPGGSVASIKLVDSSGEVLAATAVVADAVPVAFTLHTDTEFLPADGHVLLWAAFRTDIGLWGTPDLVPVTGDAVELVLQKIET